MKDNGRKPPASFIGKLAAAFVIGAFLGALGVWVDHQNEVAFIGQRQDRMSDFLVVFSYPGNILTWLSAGSLDWTVDEGWQYIMPITLWNGAFACAIWLMFLCIKYVILRNLRRQK